MTSVRVIKSSRIDHKAPVPTKEEIRSLIASADEDFKPDLIVAVLSPLRASEMRGLRWPDVDIDKVVLHPAIGSMPKTRWAGQNRGRGSVISQRV